jgi:hypothetical protein
MRYFSLALLALLSSTASLSAWSEDGHVITAKIANEFLSPEAKAAIKELLDDRPLFDDRLVIWADFIRGSSMYDKKYKNHRTWHYIDIELKIQEKDYKPADDNDHVVGAIEKFRKIVVDKSLEKETRKEALLFLIHFLGDMHQPLHCTNREDDKGGNMQSLKSFNGKEEAKLNLHKIWDQHMVQAARGELTIDDYTKRLVEELKELKEAEREKLLKGEVKDWAWEVHMVGVRNVYKFTDGTELPPRDKPGAELTMENYIKEKLPIVPEQLKRGGIRLAHVLNKCFAEEKKEKQ